MSAKKIYSELYVVVVAYVTVLVGLLVSFYGLSPTTPKIRVINASITQFHLKTYISLLQA